MSYVNYLNLNRCYKKKLFCTVCILSLALTLHQVMLVFGLHQVVLRRRRGQVLDHGEAEDEEKNVPGLHRASVRLLMADDTSR